MAKNISENQKLEIHGSKKFREKILQVVAENKFEIKFADENLVKNFKILKSKENFSVQKNLVKNSVQQILENLQEQKNKISAESHYEYINREKAFARRGDCIFTAHRLPKWSKNNPKNFFKPLINTREKIVVIMLK